MSNIRIVLESKISDYENEKRHIDGELVKLRAALSAIEMFPVSVLEVLQGGLNKQIRGKRTIDNENRTKKKYSDRLADEIAQVFKNNSNLPMTRKEIAEKSGVNITTVASIIMDNPKTFAATKGHDERGRRVYFHSLLGQPVNANGTTIDAVDQAVLSNLKIESIA